MTTTKSLEVLTVQELDEIESWADKCPLIGIPRDIKRLCVMARAALDSASKLQKQEYTSQAPKVSEGKKWPSREEFKDWAKHLDSDGYFGALEAYDYLTAYEAGRDQG